MNLVECIKKKHVERKLHKIIKYIYIYNKCCAIQITLKNSHLKYVKNQKRILKKN